ncbi:hypothetical protein [Microlunatus antarcticus]|uniref:DUF5666 domain-containing protein n=1 Tax=Microlunatus antarcticus TaxID=53388 RepID=A0A7W5JVB2_9ACTN|nr:hypothetical protein [Microlunatus antarcticus]MBB3326447.1 hypothetical protein [Microlunatus antarcticus]
MRWSRHPDNTSLGELMNSQPDTSDNTTPSDTSTAILSSDGKPDEETRIRLWPGDYMDDSTASASGAGEGTNHNDAVPDGGDSFLDDEDYLPQERRGPSRLTVGLIAALVLALGVLGGVWVEKQLGSANSAVGQGMPGGASGQGFPNGGTGGQGMPGGTSSGQALPGGAASGSTGNQAGAGGRSGGGSTAPSTPVVVGTVSSSGTKSLVVTDLGGTKHTVVITSTTTVTAPYGHNSLEAGDTVAVTGTTTSDGSVTATSVTVS